MVCASRCPPCSCPASRSFSRAVGAPRPFPREEGATWCAGERTLLRRVLTGLFNQLSKKKFGAIELEHEAGAPPKHMPAQATPPF